MTSKRDRIKVVPPPRTISSEWESFGALVLDPIGAPPDQRREMRRAFYAGAQAALFLVSEIAGAAKDDDEGAGMIEGLSGEIRRFFEDLLGGRA